MSFVDTNALPVFERLPGWRGRYFDSPNMTFAHYEFDAGASIHEHFHEQEEFWQVIEGDIEITIDGARHRAYAATAGIVLSNQPHSVKAITNGRAIVIDHPTCDFPGRPAALK